MIDIDFIEFYIQKKYKQKLEEYFEVTKSVSSKWRNVTFPGRRMKEFLYREGTLDIHELFNRIYPSIREVPEVPPSDRTRISEGHDTK